MTDTCPFSPVADHIFIISHTKYRERRESIEREMSKIGADDYEFVVQFPNPFDTFMVRMGTRNASIWLGHYRAMKIGYELGYDKIMIAEDDIAFIKDRKIIENSVSEVKKGFSFIQLDPISIDDRKYQSGISKAKNEGLAHWGVYDGSDGKWMRSAGCYCMSRKAMESVIRVYERSAEPAMPGKPGSAYSTDMAYDIYAHEIGEPILYATPNLAIQRPMTGSQQGKYTQFAQNTYSRMHINVPLYTAL